MRKPLAAGNWKMHNTLGAGRDLVSGIKAGIEGGLTGEVATEVLVCPPFTLLYPLKETLAGSPVMLGAQNVHEEEKGAFTGEVSVSMLADAGCSHVIIGHSERRHVFGESGERLNQKVRAVLAGSDMTVIYCVGETLNDREAGQTEQVVGQQMDEVLGPDVPADRLVIAYEPVWAIGTGKTATPDQAQEVHKFIRARLSSIYGEEAADGLRILYGGSVKPGNAADLMGQPDVDGALVGGACLVADDFVAIIKAAASSVR